ncbi:endonuclease III [Halanaeroarchaeum sulfurireducens]|uniref:Endonuclease III n=1 Tax=Halanaeroarchaeum sulfurireducens TaxID=1604004 RepID=A0A0F7P989_9EURY|nr:endonuclease III [Halanaeroarchaeum sulfurireducens]AKH97322.1 endonuclease III [Halanaeroarchaeum sulfurireducens]ALG81724.1 endonuclease III [Halanaeroarchaeum sulfurireducens]
MGMPRETREEQVAEVIDRLSTAYPDATISLDFSNRLELLVAVILSAQCPDERVNRVTTTLFERFPDAQAYADAEEDAIREVISSITYPNSKAEYLVGVGETLVTEHDGEVPDTMAELTDLPGVGRKTANVVLQHGHDLTEGIVVDTHVQRISRRLGITAEERPAAIENDLMEIVPREHWKPWTHWLISHGRDTCTARNPDCENCRLADICPSSKVDEEIDLASGEQW